ncbi:MAG: ferrous iron transporter B [Treponema sp.]|nr:ferrous iron transporter B [Treponema sp.]MDY2924278.1 ferrous iron transporter B [Treponema sp.]
MKIALAGNPNAGKTTLFNVLTGSNQFVGNWPGVTVEKKEGKLKGHTSKENEVVIVDLPGIYSLSPYTLEEVVSRNFLVNERPDAILNIVDGTNLERNLYLTTQLAELGIPMVIAVNMMDVVRKNGDKIHIKEMEEALGCPVFEISALKGKGCIEAAKAAVELAKNGKPMLYRHRFNSSVEHTLAHIEEAAIHSLPEEKQRWYSVKIFERDSKSIEQLKQVEGIEISKEILAHIENDIKKCEQELDDDSESIITAERYKYVESIIKSCVRKKINAGNLTISDKIDRVITNRWAALPIFAAVMFIVYYISMVTVGAAATDWANDGLFGDGFHLLGIGTSAYEEASQEFGDAPVILEAFENGESSYTVQDEETLEVSEPIEITGETVEDAKKMVEKYGEEGPAPQDYGIWIPGIPEIIGSGLEALGCADWLTALILDGIVAGVGSVIGFVPQMLVLFFLLAFLEACGYMARIAFIMDRIFRRFGLSGKSFIPMLVGTGCGIPGIMASRTIENDHDRKMTIMTTTFIPCGAKTPFIAMIAGAIFGGAPWIATGAYFIGITSIIISGIMLKKTKMFAGDVAPFVMELPSYHWPTLTNLLNSMWERGLSFIKKAGSIILLSTIVIWFLSFFGWVEGSFTMLEEDQMDCSILAKTGSVIAWLFSPLGWGNWQATVASITGLVAKENIVGTMGILYGGTEAYANMAEAFTKITGLSFLIFNLLCAPCFAAMGAIKREMNNAKWFWFAIGYECVFAYVIAFLVNQFGNLFTGNVKGTGGFIGIVFGMAVLAVLIYMIFRKDPNKKKIEA